MKKLKRKISLLLALCMVLTCITPAYADVETVSEATASDAIIREADEILEIIEEASPAEAEYDFATPFDAEYTETEEPEELLPEEIIPEKATPSNAKREEEILIRETIVDGIRITLTADPGVFPEGAELFAEKVEDESAEEAIEEAVEKERGSSVNVAKSYKFDIKMLLDGEEIQPDMSKGSVKVAFTFEEKLNDCLTAAAYHLKEEADGELTAENLEAEVKTVEAGATESSEEAALLEEDEILSDGVIEDDAALNAEVTEIEAEITGFSYYIVEFTYDELQYVLQGDSSVKLSVILDTLKLTGPAESAEVSNPELISVMKDEEGDDWTVKALRAFSTPEWMRCEINGSEYVINVTDEADTEIQFDPKSWMSQLPSDYPILSLTVPATHDSGTFNIKFERIEDLKSELFAIIDNALGKKIASGVYNWIKQRFGTVTKIVDNLVSCVVETIQKVSGQCQKDSIAEQLNNGIRALDLRFRYENGEFYIVHGCDKEGLISIFTTCYCYDGNKRLTLDKAFSDIRAFLNEHPTEAVFISVQDEGSRYDREIEEMIQQLEKKYDFEPRFANRKESEAVVKEREPRFERNISAVRYNDGQPVYRLDSMFRNKATDITDAVEDWENHWSDTVAMKKEHLKNAVVDHSVLGMMQSNVMVKIWSKNDPYNECAWPFSIELIRIWIVPVGIRVVYTAGKMIITPKEQAAKVKPYLMDLIKQYTGKGKSSEKALGLVRLDFASSNECAIIADVNTKNTHFRTRAQGEEDADYSFVYEDAADYEKEVNEFLSEAEEEVAQLDKSFEIYPDDVDSDDSDEYVLFTGAAGRPVTGTWTQDTDGYWHFATTRPFTDTWAYIINPYDNNMPAWFYFDRNGRMLTGWQWLIWNGSLKCFYLNPVSDNRKGACQLGGITPDDYTVDESGAWTVNGAVQERSAR